MQQRLADEIGGVARTELAHGFGAVALEGARADVHAKRALLVGIAVTDQAQHFALALRQWFAAGFRREMPTVTPTSTTSATTDQMI